jgi:hypothetical protein
MDSVIQIVFPHDQFGNQADVSTATQVNLAVDLFQHGTQMSVPMGSTYQPQLMYAVGNGDVQTSPLVAQQTTYTANGQVYPRWVVNNFPVTPGQQYHFMFVLAPIGQAGAAFPSIWTHAANAMTILPNPTPPSGCLP